MVSVPALVTFFVSLVSIILQVDSWAIQDKHDRASARAFFCAVYQIYRTFAYTPGIGNEDGMC